MIGAGDLCWCQAGLVRHYGVCVGKGEDGEYWFVHATMDDGVVLTSREDFRRGRVIHVEVRADPLRVLDVVDDALGAVGQPYRLFTANCEHVAREAVTGRRESKQLQRAAVATLGLMCALLVVNENGTSVDPGGRRRDGYGRFAARRWW